MLDYRNWFGGADEDEDDDPVKKTLRYLGLETAVQDVGAGISSGVGALGQGAQDIGAGIGQAILAPARAAATWAQDATTTAIPEAGGRRVPGTVLSVTEREPETEPVPGTFSEAVAPAVERARRLVLEPQFNPLEIAPASEALGIPGQAAGRAAVWAGGGGAEPTLGFTVPEAVPFVGGAEARFSPQDVGGFVGEAALDPTNFVGVPAAVRGGQRVLPAIARAIPGVEPLEALGRRGAGLVRRAGSALAGSPAPDVGPIAQLGSGVVPEGVSRRMYHGTAGAFGRPDPGQFDPDGLFGPGYYLTSDPRVAGGVGEGRFASVNPETGSTLNPDGSTYITGDPSRLLRAGYAQQRAINNLSMDQAYDVVDAVLSETMRQRGYYSSGTLESLMDLHADLSSGRAAKQAGVTPGYVIERTRSILSADNPSSDAMVSEIAGKIAPGANVRAVDVPPGLRLLDVDAPVRSTPSLLDEVEAALDDPDQVARFQNAMRDQATREVPGPMTVSRIYSGLEQALGNDKAAANRVLAAAGYDGITHAGGRRIPMRDKFGDPIEHDVHIIFPESLDKVRNAFSGEAGGAGMVPSLAPGLRSAAYNAAQGGVLGGGSEVLEAQAEGREADPAEMARRGLIGAGLGVGAGIAARRGSAGSAARSLGSGVVPHGGGVDPDEIANLARRGAEARGERIPGLPEGAQPIRATAAQEVSRLRLDLFPPDVRADIQAAAEGADFARTQRRGVLPDEAVSRLADDDARSVDDLIKGGRMGRAYNPEETVALRNAVASQANVVRDLSEQIAEATAANTTPDLLIARRAAESTKLQGLVQVAEGARSEAGRTLRQYAQQAKLIEMSPDQAIARIRARIADPDEFAAIVDEYTQAVNEGADPIVMAKLWSKVERGEIKAGDIFALYRRFNMLSGPRTFEVNAVSGALNLGYEMLGQAGMQGLRGRGAEMAAELGAPLKAGARAFQNMAETMWHGVSAEQAARGDIPRNLSARTDNPAAKAALTALEIPDRLNAGVDQFFRTMTEDWAATTLAHKQARADGLTPRSPEWAETVATKLEAIREDVSAFPEVKAMADRVTFSEEPGGIVKGLEELKRRSPNLVGFVAPFIRTPANIASRAVDISPLGPVRTAVEAATGMGRGRTNLSTRVRDNVIGTGATYWAYTKAEQGELTGAGPDDPEKQAELRATGWQPYSIKIGDQYWSYANFAPFSLALSAGAAASEAKRYAKPGKDDTLSMLADGAMRTGKVVTDMTVLAGIGAVIKAQQDPDRYGTQWLTTALTQLMPAGSFANTVGQWTDPLVRRSERTDVGTQVSQNLQARVPWLRETVPAAQDPLGRDIQSEQTGFRALNPFRPTTERDEPVLQTFLAAGVDIGKPRQDLTISSYDDAGHVTESIAMPLTAAEQREWNRLRGEALSHMLEGASQDPSFASRPGAVKETYLRDKLEAANAYATRTVRGQIGAEEVARRVAPLRRAG